MYRLDSIRKNERLEEEFWDREFLAGNVSQVLRCEAIPVPGEFACDTHLAVEMEGRMHMATEWHTNEKPPMISDRRWGVLRDMYEGVFSRDLDCKKYIRDYLRRGDVTMAKVAEKLVGGIKRAGSGWMCRIHDDPNFSAEDLVKFADSTTPLIEANNDKGAYGILATLGRGCFAVRRGHRPAFQKTFPRAPPGSRGGRPRPEPS